MLEDKKFFRTFWFCLRFFGLQPHNLNRVQLARGMLLFLTLVFVNFVLSIAKISTTESAEIKVSMLQVFPVFIVMLVDMITFIRSSRDIEEFFDSLSEIAGEEKLFNKSYNRIMRINTVLGGLATLSVVGNSLTLLLAGKPITPIWIPNDHGLVFIVIWANNSFYIAYHILCIWLVESFIFVIFGLLNAHSLYLRKSIQNMSMTKEDLVKCVEKYLEFKKYFKLSCHKED